MRAALITLRPWAYVQTTWRDAFITVTPTNGWRALFEAQPGGVQSPSWRRPRTTARPTHRDQRDKFTVRRQHAACGAGPSPDPGSRVSRSTRTGTPVGIQDLSVQPPAVALSPTWSSRRWLPYAGRLPRLKACSLRPEVWSWVGTGVPEGVFVLATDADGGVLERRINSTRSVKIDEIDSDLSTPAR